MEQWVASRAAQCTELTADGDGGFAARSSLAWHSWFFYISYGSMSTGINFL